MAALGSEPGAAPRAKRAVRALLEPRLHAGRQEAGVDEAGRGCLAGPVVAAAVMWPADLTPERLRAEAAQDDRWYLVRDSKQLSGRQRERARELIEERALAWAVHAVPAAQIDAVNILRATFQAMHGALDALVEKLGGDGAQLDAVVVDGERFPGYLHPVSCDIVPHACVIEGDALYLSIAAASVLAKTHRDRLMRGEVHARYPAYGFDKHVVYGTQQHMRALVEHGPCPEHRRTFKMPQRAEPGDGQGPARPHVAPQYDA